VLTIVVLLMAHAGALGRPKNALANGDAEVQPCTPDWAASTSVASWRVLRGGISVLCYAAFNFTDDRNMTTPRPWRRGRALFTTPSTDAAMVQTVVLDPRAWQAVDSGAVPYTLTAWLGGWRREALCPLVTAVFESEAGLGLATATLCECGPAARANATALVALSKDGTVPLGTRAIAITVTFQNGLTSYANSFADNIALLLPVDAVTPSPTPKLAVPTLVRFTTFSGS
jgi:hypothetical protein